MPYCKESSIPYTSVAGKPLRKEACQAFDAQDATVVSPNNAKFVTRYLHNQDTRTCVDSKQICAGKDLWTTTNPGNKTYATNLEDFTILLQHSISKVCNNIYYTTA